MWCVTFTRGVTPAEVLRGYGADPGTAQMLSFEEAQGLYPPGDGSVLRAGALDGWAFCYEDIGVMGAMPGPLSVLSWGTETLSVLRGGDGMNGFSWWYDGQQVESFEPGFVHTRPRSPSTFWDAVQARIDAAGDHHVGLRPTLEVVAGYIGAVLDTATLRGRLLTVRLDEADRAPDPERNVRSVSGGPSARLGRFLGTLDPGPGEERH
ncbi:DUF6461 domain-containing protein [Marinactinospora thermotolerans]|uniref:DUF6461 domain-containing protein n=1 Tax=Marinactinospora thermotolerans TaxID=531310 RepID=UPI003D8FBC3E